MDKEREMIIWLLGLLAEQAQRASWKGRADAFINNHSVPLSVLLKNYCVIGLQPICVVPKDMDCQCRFFKGEIGELCQMRCFDKWCGSAHAIKHARQLHSLPIDSREAMV